MCRSLLSATERDLKPCFYVVSYITAQLQFSGLKREKEIKVSDWDISKAH